VDLTERGIESICSPAGSAKAFLPSLKDADSGTRQRPNIETPRPLREGATPQINNLELIYLRNVSGRRLAEMPARAPHDSPKFRLQQHSTYRFYSK
jgi:hypothetical protein